MDRTFIPFTADRYKTCLKSFKPYHTFRMLSINSNTEIDIHLGTGFKTTFFIF